MKKPLILKFGGAAVATPERFASIADIILRRREAYPHLVIVVSAMGDTTDQLLELAYQVNENPPQRELDMLVSVGERISISLLAMALAKKGCRAVSFTGSQSGIITTGVHTEARIIDVKPLRLEEVLAGGDIAIVAGFQGVSRQREITTLGRGGSDTSAVALAVALGAERVEFYKDVPGVFDKDPKVDVRARSFESLSYVEALAIVRQGAGILHARCIELAEANGIPLHVLSFLTEDVNAFVGTRIGGGGEGRTQAVYEEEAIEKQTCS